MLVTCWSVKGGVGTTAVAASLAVLASRVVDNATLLVDLAGDVPAILGVDEPVPTGVLDLIGATTVTACRDATCVGSPGAIASIEVTLNDRLSILPWGDPHASGLALSAVDALIDRLVQDGRTVIVDAGRIVAGSDDGVRQRFIRRADRSLLVTRACYLAMRHAARSTIRPDGVILVSEAGRSLEAADVTSVTGASVIAEVAYEPQVARVIDAGLLCSRMPRSIERALSRVIGVPG